MGSRVGRRQRERSGDFGLVAGKVGMAGDISLSVGLEASGRVSPPYLVDILPTPQKNRQQGQPPRRVFCGAKRGDIVRGHALAGEGGAKAK